MPSFPVYESQANINPSIQPPERHQAAEAFKATDNLNKTITDLTQQWSDRNDVMQETKSKNSAELALYQNEVASQNDPNPNNAEMYIKASNKIVEDSTKGIDNQEVAGQTKLDIQHSAFLSQIKIQDLFKGKQILSTKESQQQANIIAAKKIATAVSSASAQQTYDSTMSQIRTLNGRGIYTPDEALASEKELKTEIVKARIDNNKSTNPEDYKGIDEGMGLDIKETSEMQKMVAAHIKQVDDQNIVDTAKNRVSVLKAIATKQIGFQTTNQIKNLAKGDSKLQNSLQMVMDAKAEGHEYQPKEENNQETSDAISKVIKAKNVQELSDYLVDAAKDKNMTEDRLAILINAVEKRAESLPSRGVKDLSPTDVSINGGYDAVERWNKQYGNNDPQTLLDYGKSVMEGKSPEEAYKIATDSKKIRNNPAMLTHKIGDDVNNDKFGLVGKITGFTEEGVPKVTWKIPKQETKDTLPKDWTPEEKKEFIKESEDFEKAPGEVLSAIGKGIETVAEKAAGWVKKNQEEGAAYYKKQAKLKQKDTFEKEEDERNSNNK